MPQCKTMDEKRDCAPEIARYKCRFTPMQYLARQNDTMTSTARRCTLFWGTLAFAFSGTLHAAPPRHAAAPAATSVAAPTAAASQPGISAPLGPALWKVSDHDTTIYLFGTVHILPDETTAKWFTPLIASSLQSSNQLVTEVIPETDKGDAGVFIRKAALPPGQNLRTMMPAEDRAAYEKALGAIAIPPAAFDTFKPWYAALMLSMLPLIKHGYSPAEGVEAVLTARKAPGTATTALETMQFQIDLFDTLPQDIQLSYLRSTVKAAPDMDAAVSRMIDDWLAGDAEKLADLINDPETDPALLDKLLYARNAAWADWIKQRLDQPGTVFVAVGAGHLAGKGSVQEELRARGIGSERIQ